MSFPATRMLRNRKNPQLRNLLAETFLTRHDFIYPLFVNETLKEKKVIQKMPGIFQQSPSTLLKEIERIVNLGIEAVILFGIPKTKNPQGTEAYNPKGIVQKSIQMIKKEFPDLIVIADCCMCEYTSHGHCGIIRNEENDELDNDQTLTSLQKIALSYAESGVDIIAPSGMIDGMVLAIREALDRKNYSMIPIMSYAVKFASQFYGPFREAAGSEDNLKGDRKHHQLAPSQKREALREAYLDVDESADYLMVKPGLPYLDLIQLVRDNTLLPIVAYQVSGEYAMLKLAAAQGLCNEVEVFKETLTCIKRAGADLIITYYADEIIKHI